MSESGFGHGHCNHESSRRNRLRIDADFSQALPRELMRPNTRWPKENQDQTELDPAMLCQALVISYMGLFMMAFCMVHSISGPFKQAGNASIRPNGQDAEATLPVLQSAVRLFDEELASASRNPVLRPGVDGHHDGHDGECAHTHVLHVYI